MAGLWTVLLRAGLGLLSGEDAELITRRNDPGHQIAMHRVLHAISMETVIWLQCITLTWLSIAYKSRTMQGALQRAAAVLAKERERGSAAVMFVGWKLDAERSKDKGRRDAEVEKLERENEMRSAEVEQLERDLNAAGTYGQILVARAQELEEKVEEMQGIQIPDGEPQFELSDQIREGLQSRLDGMQEELEMAWKSEEVLRSCNSQLEAENLQLSWELHERDFQRGEPQSRVEAPSSTSDGSGDDDETEAIALRPRRGALVHYQELSDLCDHNILNNALTNENKQLALRVTSLELQSSTFEEEVAKMWEKSENDHANENRQVVVAKVQNTILSKLREQRLKNALGKEMQEMVLDFEADRAGLEEECQDFAAEIEQAHMYVGYTEAEARSLSENVATLQEELDCERFRAVSGDLVLSVDAEYLIKGPVEVGQVEIAEMKDRIATLKARNRELEGKLNRYAERELELHERIHSMTAQIDELGHRLRTSEEQRELLLSRTNILEAEVEAGRAAERQSQDEPLTTNNSSQDVAQEDASDRDPEARVGESRVEASERQVHEELWDMRECFEASEARGHALVSELAVANARAQFEHSEAVEPVEAETEHLRRRIQNARMELQESQWSHLESEAILASLKADLNLERDEAELARRLRADLAEGALRWQEENAFARRLQESVHDVERQAAEENEEMTIKHDAFKQAFVSELEADGACARCEDVAEAEAAAAENAQYRRALEEERVELEVCELRHFECEAQSTMLEAQLKFERGEAEQLGSLKSDIAETVLRLKGEQVLAKHLREEVLDAERHMARAEVVGRRAAELECLRDELRFLRTRILTLGAEEGEDKKCGIREARTGNRYLQEEWELDALKICADRRFGLARAEAAEVATCRRDFQRAAASLAKLTESAAACPEEQAQDHLAECAESSEVDRQQDEVQRLRAEAAAYEQQVEDGRLEERRLFASAIAEASMVKHRRGELQDAGIPAFVWEHTAENAPAEVLQMRMDCERLGAELYSVRAEVADATHASMTELELASGRERRLLAEAKNEVACAAHVSMEELGSAADRERRLQDELAEAKDEGARLADVEMEQRVARRDRAALHQECAQLSEERERFCSGLVNVEVQDSAHRLKIEEQSREIESLTEKHEDGARLSAQAAQAMLDEREAGRRRHMELLQECVQLREETARAQDGKDSEMRKNCERLQGELDEWRADAACETARCLAHREELQELESSADTERSNSERQRGAAEAIIANLKADLSFERGEAELSRRLKADLAEGAVRWQEESAFARRLQESVLDVERQAAEAADEQRARFQQGVATKLFQLFGQRDVLAVVVGEWRRVCEASKWDLNFEKAERAVQENADAVCEAQRNRREVVEEELWTFAEEGAFKIQGLEQEKEELQMHLAGALDAAVDAKEDVALGFRELERLEGHCEELRELFTIAKAAEQAECQFAWKAEQRCDKMAMACMRFKQEARDAAESERVARDVVARASELLRREHALNKSRVLHDKFQEIATAESEAQKAADVATKLERIISDMGGSKCF